MHPPYIHPRCGPEEPPCRIDLDYALGKHRLGDFHEACDVGALHIVYVSVLLCAVLDA